jgi:cell division GTPase FtsZ
MVLLLQEWVVVQAGAAPVIAIKEREILTVGIVTSVLFEGKVRQERYRYRKFANR